MIKVGFTVIGGKTNWMGGINYLKNLLFAIKHSGDNKVQSVLFIGYNIDEKIVKEFEGLAIIKRNSVFDRFSFKWFIDFILRDIFKINPIINQLIKVNKINVFSHSFIYGKDLKCLSVNWVPDFQHLRLPKMFSKLNLIVRNYRLGNMVKYSDRIILSSYDALNDYKKIYSNYLEKASVIHFVSQVSIFEFKPVFYLQEKFNFNSKYFFLPNQFWVHKNHKVVFEAIKLLKEKNPTILLICSGILKDHRNKKYINSIKKFIIKNELKKNILLLGLIPYNDVKLLMYHSIAIINPSYFEGWSSTVEEAKSMGKALILSDIPVHNEQATGKADFFVYDQPHLLSDIILKYWINENEVIISENDLKLRTQVFSNKYKNLLISITNFNS